MIKEKIIAILMIIIFAVSIVGRVYAVSEQDKKDLENKINSTKNEINDINSEKKEAKTELEKISEQVETLQGELDNLKSQLSSLQNSIDEKNKEIEKKEKEIAEKEALLKERVVALYEAGDTSFLDVLFHSSNVIEFLSNYAMVQQIVECDTNLIQSIENSKAIIEEDKKQLEANKAEVEEVKRQQETKNAQLQQAKSAKQQEVNKLSEDEKAKQSELEEYNAKLREVENAIQEAMRKAIEEERKNQNNGSSNGGSTGGNGSSFDGTFGWPLDFSPRVVTSKMYYRTYNGTTRWHKGIDIGTDGVTGKRVVASASGTVIYSAYQAGGSAAGYGNYLVIYHGNDYSTLYAHMNSKSVSVGQKVSKGQLIGYSGNTGGVAPHLHFEIRKANSVGNFFGSNNWKDPLAYLPGGYTVRQ